MSNGLILPSGWTEHKPAFDRQAWENAMVRRKREEVRLKAYQQERMIEGRFDSELWTSDNENHWWMADNYSPARMANAATRRILRRRSRYELLNNSWAWGMVLAKTNSIIGTGPRLQFQTENKETNEILEAEWMTWSREVNLAETLRVFYQSVIMSGEAFLTPRTSPLTHAVQMSPFTIESDQVASPSHIATESGTLDDFDPRTTDGILYDENNNVRGYQVLTAHPGSGQFTNQAVLVPASQMVHYFKAARPNQPRGIPSAVAALPLFAYLRRFTLATVAAAEIAADYAAIIKTDGGAVFCDDGSGTTQMAQTSQGDPWTYDASVDPFRLIDIERGMITALPAGWDMMQFDAKNPQTTYQMFVEMIITELARCFQLPYFMAVGKAKDFTWASGKLDRDNFLDLIDLEQHDIANRVLEKMLVWWWDEATLAGIIPPGTPPLVEIKHRWTWDEQRETDPLKQAQALKAKWDMGFVSDQEVAASLGRDPQEHWAQMKETFEARKDIGLPLPGRSTITPAPDEGAISMLTPGGEEDEEAEEEDGPPVGESEEQEAEANEEENASADAE